MTQPFVFEQLDAGELLAAGETAQSRAAEIVAAAEAAAAAIEEAARERGFVEGHAAGLAAADHALGPVSAALGETVERLADLRAEFVAVAELRAVELALALAGKVLGAALAADPALVCEIVAGALRRVTDLDGIVIELHPDDVELVGAWIDAGKNARVSIDVRADRRVARGGCIVRTSEGEVDARLAEQLAAAEELLREAFAAGRAA
jgi:flagellar biosynthesis/type III secretory pathway protein FliH